MNLEDLKKEVESIKKQCQDGKPDVWDVLFLIEELIEILQEDKGEWCKQ